MSPATLQGCPAAMASVIPIHYRQRRHRSRPPVADGHGPRARATDTFCPRSLDRHRVRDPPTPNSRPNSTAIPPQHSRPHRQRDGMNEWNGMEWNGMEWNGSEKYGIDISYEVTGTGPGRDGDGQPAAGPVSKADQQPPPSKRDSGSHSSTTAHCPSPKCPQSSPSMTWSPTPPDSSEHLGDGPAIVVGTSLGAHTSPRNWPRPARRRPWCGDDATYGRNRRSRPANAPYDNGITLPPDYEAAITAHPNLSPHTFDDDRHAQDWLDIIGFSPQKVTPSPRPVWHSRTRR